MKKNTNSKWAIWGLVLLGLVMLSVVVTTNSTPKPMEEEKLSTGDSITVPIEALIDGPRVCFARIDVDGKDKYVNLGEYPACQEHTVGQKITVKKEDIDELGEMEETK